MIDAFKRILFPQICLHCNEPLLPNQSIFCLSCFSSLELINPETRCLTCFSQYDPPKRAICPNCQKEKRALTAMAAAFDYIGPAATLIRKIKYSYLPFLAKGAGGFLTAQFLQLNWPLPDLIIPAPLSWTHKLERGFNQSFLLAEEMGRHLSCPVQELLGRKAGDYSQAGLSLEQRKQLSDERFYVKKTECLAGKNILLIDDVMTSGTTLERCAFKLNEFYPDAIYGLTLCKTID